VIWLLRPRLPAVADFDWDVGGTPAGLPARRNAIVSPIGRYRASARAQPALTASTPVPDN